jgi:hypothetical protein
MNPKRLKDLDGQAGRKIPKKGKKIIYKKINPGSRKSKG